MPKPKPKTHRVPSITFKDVTKDTIPFIEVTVTGRIKSCKSAKDEISWKVVNLTKSTIEVAVLDFYATSTVNGGSTGGGSVFADGKPPLPITVKPGATVNTKRAKTDGDEDIVYKYSVVARAAADVESPPGPWFLVKDPELELDL